MNKTTNLLLAYPDNFIEYEGVDKNFYRLFNSIPKDILLTIISSSELCSKELAFHFPNAKILQIDGFNEIWLRDVMGFPIGNKIIKPRFEPTYMNSIYTKEHLAKLSKNIAQIHKYIGKEVIEIDLIWDCGNLVSNGEIGFITEKLLQDNSDKSRSEIDRIIQDQLGIIPVYIPNNKYDEVSHSDGYMAFIDDHTIGIASYPEINTFKEDQQYLRYLRKIARIHGLRVVDIKERPVVERAWMGTEFVHGARGNFVNWLKLNNHIILPEFDLPAYPAQNCLVQNTNTLKKMGYSVSSVDCTELAMTGGVLHCISWEF